MIDFADSYRGGKFEVSYERYDPCDECDSTGSRSRSQPTKCPDCGGKGQIRERVRTIFGIMEQASPCPRCEGTGEIIDDPCHACQGSKRKKSKQTYTVEVPAGIDDGMTLQVRGEGSNTIASKARGDLYVHVRVIDIPHHLERRGDDLVYTLLLHPVELILGNKKTIKIPVVGERTIEVAAGTQPGHMIKLKSDGFPSLKRRDHRGDLYIILEIEIPKKLSKREKELYLEIAKERGFESEEEKGFLERLFCD